MSILEVNNIYKKFGNTEVLKGVSFSMNEGEVISILGSSGSGKTTLLRCINFLEHADEGIIKVNDEVIFDANTLENKAKDIRKAQLNFGLVFQSFNLFPQYNVFENVTLAPKLLAKEREDYKNNKQQIIEEIEENAKKVIESVGLSAKMDSYPCQLSGGQQQRVSIARALALKPKILFFDEPTSALDPELTGEILRVIKQLAKENITMVIVTHEINFAKNVSDRIIFMDDGIVAEEGTPEQVIDNPQNPRTKEFLSQFRD
ncbi:MAG: amino acid ABC transporter ATP-binding protein [Clostridia bacterium]|nr:amino acid ABC transporter ATP-binding protein [Clostridia bacterium]